MASKISLIKKLDSLLGPIAVAILRPKREDKRLEGGIRSILFVRPGGIGDAVLLLPALRLAYERFPAARIDVLCEKRNAGIFDLAQVINKVYLYDKRGGLYDCLKNRYDIVIDTEQWHRLSAVVAYLTKAPVRIGFDTNERSSLFTHKIPYSHDDYEVYSFLRLLEPFADPLHKTNADAPFMGAEQVNPELLSGLAGKMDKAIAIFPGASVAERRWGGERFAAVAKALADRGYTILILGSGADRNDAERIKRSAKGAVDLTGRTTLKEVTAILKKCLLLVAADSGLLHIAYAVGTPTVSLFGSGIERKWGPRGGRHIIINKHLECSPCTKFGYTPNCKRHMACLSSISADEVIKVALGLLEKGSQ